MTDYTKLVEDLRGKFIAYDVTGNNNSAQLYKDAAAAIEDMAKHITEMHERVTVLQIARGELEAEVKRLKMHCADCEYGNSPWPEEPVHEPKRGEWEPVPDPEGRPYKYVCSNCHRFHVNEDEWYGYCPNCGAVMGVPIMDGPIITPCRGCSDYDGYGGCKSKGGCARAKMEGMDANRPD